MTAEFILVWNFCAGKRAWTTTWTADRGAVPAVGPAGLAAVLAGLRCAGPHLITVIIMISGLATRTFQGWPEKGRERVR